MLKDALKDALKVYWKASKKLHVNSSLWDLHQLISKMRQDSAKRKY